MVLKVMNQRQETAVLVLMFFCEQNFPVKRFFICIILGRSRSRRSGSGSWLRLLPDTIMFWLRIRNPGLNYIRFLASRMHSNHCVISWVPFGNQATGTLHCKSGGITAFRNSHIWHNFHWLNASMHHDFLHKYVKYFLTL